jgi:hypothetical protein
MKNHPRHYMTKGERLVDMAMAIGAAVAIGAALAMLATSAIVRWVELLGAK